MSEARFATSSVERLNAQPGLLTGVSSADNDSFAPHVTEISFPARPAGVPTKRVIDIVGAAFAIVFFAPLMAVIYVLVRRDGGPGVFAQQRIGRNGRIFSCYKFRSMIPNAEEALKNLICANEKMRVAWETDRKLENDPRVTPLGVFLRRKSLDELPQLFNVLKGDMSLVGPRPIVLDEKGKYGAAFDYYTQMRPGLTGLWQVSGRNDIAYEERVKLDTDYVRRWSLRRDIAILVKTVAVVINGRGAR
ncbi:MAG: sugar transferase [Amphiplicatus sp.]